MNTGQIEKLNQVVSHTTMRLNQSMERVSNTELMCDYLEGELKEQKTLRDQSHAASGDAVVNYLSVKLRQRRHLLEGHKREYRALMIMPYHQYDDVAAFDLEVKRLVELDEHDWGEWEYDRSNVHLYRAKQEVGKLEMTGPMRDESPRSNNSRLCFHDSKANVCIHHSCAKARDFHGTPSVLEREDALR